MKLTINNFGPLDDATIQIGDFTVLAGPNNTGKSFVSKSLYSLFDAMNANHALVAFEVLAQPLEMLLQLLEKIGHKSEKLSLSALRDENQRVEHILREAFSVDPQFPQTESEIDKIRTIQPRRKWRRSSIDSHQLDTSPSPSWRTLASALVSIYSTHCNRKQMTPTGLLRPCRVECPLAIYRHCQKHQLRGLLARWQALAPETPAVNDDLHGLAKQ